MQDPSNGVPHQLLPHLACVNNFRYPTAQRLSLDSVFEYLLQAPQIVKQLQPMHWEYLNGPQDGTMYLCWQPPSRQGQFASDGYVWNDQESMFTQDVRGYVSFPACAVHICVFVDGFLIADTLRRVWKSGSIEVDTGQATSRSLCTNAIDIALSTKEIPLRN